MMTQQATAVTFLIVVAAATIATGAKQCNETWLENCKGYQDSLELIEDPNPIFKLETQDKLDELCSNVAGLHQCLPESNCQDQLEDHLEGKVDRFIKTADYICSDDIKPGYLDHIGCTLNDDVMHNKSKCAGPDHMKDCKTLTEHLKCTRQAIEARCEKATADVYIGAMKKINKDPCSGAPGGAVCQQFAPLWILSCVVWLLMTSRCQPTLL